MLKNISIENFRGLKKAQIDDFKSINLFIGKNGCGKTTILESIFMLCNACDIGVPIMLNTARRIRVVNEEVLRLLFFNLECDTPIELSGKTTGPAQHRRLKISSDSGRQKKIFDQEPLYVKDNSINFQSTAKEPQIGQLKLLYAEKTDKKLTKISKTLEISGDRTSYTYQNMSKEEIVKTVIPASIINVSELGRNSGLLFRNISLNKQKQKLVELLRKSFPNLQNLEFQLDGIYCDTGLPKLLPLSVMGEGFYKVMQIALNIVNAEAKVLLIDEIENGLYFSTQQTLWKAILDFAINDNIQFFIATHSYETLTILNTLLTNNGNYSFKDIVRLYRIENQNAAIHSETYDTKSLNIAIEHNWEIR